MVTSLYTADIKINPTDKDYHRYLIVMSDSEGVLIVNRGLFVLSFETVNDFINSDVEIKDKRYIGDINL